MQHEMKFDAFHRYLGGNHGLRFIGHIRVHAANSIDLQIGIGKQAVRSRRLRCGRLLGPGRGRFCRRRGQGTGFRRALAERRGDVDDIQTLGFELRVQRGLLALGIHVCVARNVTRTERALQAVDGVKRSRNVHFCRQPVLRRVGQGEARQVEDVRQIVAGDDETRIKFAQIERFQYRDVSFKVDIGRRQPCGEGIGVTRRQIDERTAIDVQLERLLIERSEAADFECGRIVSAFLIDGQQRPAERQLTYLVEHVQSAVLDRQSANGGYFCGRGVVIRRPRLGPQLPACAAFGIALEVDRRVFQIDYRENQLSAKKMQQTDAHEDALGAEHGLAVGPRRIF